ncbi:hypothetical protein C0993_008547 [Termitomyces sp. T159_Od127]|nr:hypothetical protein C0993_008547 [Termitomyces sp. T159_Od127]
MKVQRLEVKTMKRGQGSSVAYKQAESPDDAQHWTLRVEKVVKRLTECMRDLDSAFSYLDSLLEKAETRMASKECPRDVRHWTLKVERVAWKLTKYIGNSGFDYLESLYMHFVTTQDSSNIFQAIVCVEKLEKWLKTYQNEILQLSGAQGEWKRSEDVLNRVSSILKSLEDLGLYATLPEQDLPALHASEELLYQSLLK